MCHRFKKKSYYREHKRTCRGSPEDILHFQESRVGIGKVKGKKFKQGGVKRGKGN
jgi:hypothetical protein